jgi:D-threonate/D-erythronate kinase
MPDVVDPWNSDSAAVSITGGAAGGMRWSVAMTASQDPPPHLVGLVADDLTGAGDSALGFAEQGWRVELLLNTEHSLQSNHECPESRPTVLAVTTGSRAFPDDRAADVTDQAVTGVLAAGAERLYLKIDSTVRGSVAGQIRGALTAWRRRFPAAGAIICPAFPTQSRTVHDGTVLVGGLPVTQTAAATDPVTPVASGDLRVIVPGAVTGTLDQVGKVSPLLLDATTDSDLDAIAHHAAAAGAQTLVVGSGGLAAALARRWAVDRSPTPPPTVGTRRILLAASSLHPVTTEQLRLLSTTAHAAHVDVLATPSGEITTPSAAAAALAARVSAALTDPTYGALVIVGGDGAAVILACLSTDRILIDGALSGGCPTGIVVGGTADGLRLVTKSGGFGVPETLAAITARLCAPDATHRPDPDQFTPKEAS